MIGNALRLTLHILLFRAGPQDFPFDPLLTRFLLPFGVLANYAVFAMVLPPGLAVAMAAAMIGGVAIATRLILRARQLDGRFMQTWHSLLACTGTLTLLLIPPFAQIAPEFSRLAENPELAAQNNPVQLPAGPSFIMNILNVWNFAVTAHIYRHAANVNLWIGALLALLVAISTLMFVVFFGSLAGVLLGAG